MDPPEEVRRITAGRGVDTAIEAAALEKKVDQAISSVKYGGLVTIAALLDETIRVNTLRVALKEIQLDGSYGTKCCAKLSALIAFRQSI